MKKHIVKKYISLLLVVVLAVSSLLSATAATVVGDVNGDGKLTVFDAQLLLEAQKGLRQLTDDQKAAAGKLSLEQILGILLGTYVPPSVQVGDTYLSTDLASTAANGEKGMTYYYTDDGKTVTPFANYDPNNHGGRWYYMDPTMRSFVDPFVIPTDNYGWIGTSEEAYVVVGYEMPASGQISMFNWLALHTGHDCRLMVAQGSVDNIIDVLDVKGAVDTVADVTTTLNVTEGEEIFVIYKTLESAPTADTCYLGYKTQYTYLSVGQTPGSTTESAEEISAAVKNRTDAVAANAGLAALSCDVQLMPIGTRAQVYTHAAYENGVATFTYTDGETSVDYVIDTAWDKVKTGMIEVQTRRNGGALVQAVTNAGTGYRNSSGTLMTPNDYAAVASVTMTPSFDATTGTLNLHYRETYQSVTNEKHYAICLDQKSLVIHVTSDSQNGNSGYADFRCGRSDGLNSPAIHNSVYVEEVSVTEIDNTYFLSAYLDKAKTFSTRVTNAPSCYATGAEHGLNANYEINSAGRTNPLNEVFYVTVSDDLLDCVYLTNGEKSRYHDSMINWIVYDNWDYTSSYTQRKNTYMDLALSYGLTDVLLVEHRWQRDTLDISNPAHYPASTAWGTAAEFTDYIETVKQTLGWTLALHEDYWFMYPSAANQYWNVANVKDLLAQNADGSLRYGWQDSYANKSDVMALYAQKESTQIENAYDPGASFLDVSGGVDPSCMNQVTLNANSTTSRTLAQVVADNASLFCQQRQLYSGPVISEGAQGNRSFGSAYAGYLDSGSREITECSNCRIMPDYELKYIRPLMVNQGMGPLARFQLNEASNTYDFDKYNAACIAYGHTGFIGDVHYTLPLRQEQMINTYYMFRALQPQYLDSDVTVEQILYYTASGTAMELNAAVHADYDFTAPRLYIRYSNGLAMYLNFMEENWQVTLNGHSYTLDKNGYCAENPNLDFIQYSCLKSGVRVDYVKSRAYTYANPRGNTVDFGDGLKGNLLMLRSDELDLNVKNPTQTAPIRFADLAYYGNGTKGLTFYYTTDGQNLNKFNSYDGTTGRFYHTDGGVLKSFVDPREVVADNYGLVQTSENEYVVMTYKVPSTGTVELYVWTANQSGAGYTVTTALGSMDNVISNYRATAVGEGAVDIITVTVTEGETIYLSYKPINGKAGDWFGYATSVTYLYAEG